MNQIRTVVELDMVGYSDIARKLEKEYGDPKVVAELNKEIQQFVDVGLKAVSLAREKVVKATNGDNAVIVFESASDAHFFAEAVHGCTQDYNNKRDWLSAKRWFRIGCATGKLHQEPRNDSESIAGIVIANAYRLEAQAKPGELLIDAPTYDALKNENVLTDAKIRECYPEEETVPGKPHEKQEFIVRRWPVIPRVSLWELAEQDPEVRSTVDQYFINLKRIYKIINKLHNYKLLHENFQNLEPVLPLLKTLESSLSSSTYSLILREIDKYNSDDSSLNKYMSNIKDILEKENQELGINKYRVNDWKRNLESIKESLTTAAGANENNDFLKPLKNIIRALTNLIYNEGITLLDKKLFNSAEDLELETLTNDLRRIKNLLDSNNISYPSQLDDIDQNIMDINTINQKLTKMLGIHNNLQFFDNKFRGIQYELDRRNTPDGLDDESKNIAKNQILESWNSLFGDFITLFNEDLPDKHQVENIRKQATDINVNSGANNLDERLRKFEKGFIRFVDNVNKYFKLIDNKLIDLIEKELITNFETNAVLDISHSQI